MIYYVFLDLPVQKKGLEQQRYHEGAVPIVRISARLFFFFSFGRTFSEDTVGTMAGPVRSGPIIHGPYILVKFQKSK